MRWLASVAFLTIGILNGLGAVGHSFMGRLAVDAELAKFPVASNVLTMLYAVWYFVGGCMALFACTILWAWFRLRRGERGLLFATALIGILYMATGVGGFAYRHGDPFFLVFIVEGSLLTVSSLVLSGSREVLAVERSGEPQPL